MTSAIAAVGCDVTTQEMRYASCFRLPYASFGGSESCERVCVVKWLAKIVLVAVVPVVVLAVVAVVVVAVVAVVIVAAVVVNRG